MNGTEMTKVFIHSFILGPLLGGDGGSAGCDGDAVWSEPLAESPLLAMKRPQVLGGFLNLYQRGVSGIPSPCHLPSPLRGPPHWGA